MSEVDPTKFRKLCDDMDEVKSALLGSEEYRQKGALLRLDETEERSFANKNKIERIWAYAVGAGVIIGLAFEGVRMAFA